MPDYDARRQYVYDTLVARTDESQADLRSLLDRFHIGYTPYYLVNAVEVDGGLVARLLLTGRNDVSRILPSPRLRPLPGALDAGSAEAEMPQDHDWTLKLLGAEKVWQEFAPRSRYCRRPVRLGRRRDSPGTVGRLPRPQRRQQLRLV